MQRPDSERDGDISPKSTGEEGSGKSNLSSPMGSPTGRKIIRKSSSGSPRTFFPSGNFSIDIAKSPGTSPTVTITSFDAKNPKKNNMINADTADKDDTPTPTI